MIKINTHNNCESCAWRKTKILDKRKIMDRNKQKTIQLVEAIKGDADLLLFIYIFIDNQLLNITVQRWDFNQKMEVVVLSVHLGAHDLDPMDSEDCARCHEEPLFLYLLSNPVGCWFLISQNELINTNSFWNSKKDIQWSPYQMPLYYLFINILSPCLRLLFYIPRMPRYHVLLQFITRYLHFLISLPSLCRWRRP